MVRTFFFNLFIFYYLFIYLGCVGSFVAVHRFSLVSLSRTTLHCGARASHCDGFSSCRAQALGTQASVVVAHELSSCGARA